MSTLRFIGVDRRADAGRRRVHSSVEPHRTEPHRTGGPFTTTTVAPRPQAAAGGDAALAGAFRELHGARLHGFALLVALGDLSAAGVAATAALEEAGGRLVELRHPERAAAWLRARVVRRLPRAARSPRRVGSQAAAALRELGVGEHALAGLRSLSYLERVALVAAVIERFDPIDVERIVQRPATPTRRLVAAARRRYLVAAAAGQESEAPTTSATGMVTERIELLATRTLGGWRSP